MNCYRLVPMILLFGGLYWNGYGLMSNRGTSPLQEKKLDYVHKSLKAENAEVNSLKNQMAKLEQLVASLNSQLSQIKADSWNESADRDAKLKIYADNNELKDPMTIIQQAKRKEEQRQASIENTFSDEMIDETWSKKSNKIINSVLDDEFVKNTHVLDSQCHSTLCRLEVQHLEMSDLTNFETFLPLQIGENFSELTMHHQNGEEGEVSTIIYLARNGYQLPDVEMDE